MIMTMTPSSVRDQMTPASRYFCLQPAGLRLSVQPHSSVFAPKFGNGHGGLKTQLQISRRRVSALAGVFVFASAAGQEEISAGRRAALLSKRTMSGLGPIRQRRRIGHSNQASRSLMKNVWENAHQRTMCARRTPLALGGGHLCQFS